MNKDDNSKKRQVSNNTTYTNVNTDTYANKLKEEGIINSEEIADYKINEIEVVSEEQKKVILEMDKQYYKNDDIFAFLTYSVKPEDLDSSVLNTGTGVKNGEWITFNRICVCIRDGKIISAGTSW